ncbi:MAG: ABC transporter substrate-binding protein [Halanaerobium sp.]
MRKIIGLMLVLGLIFVAAGNLDAQEVEIEYWHAMSGMKEDMIEEQVEAFNELHDDIHVNVEYQGSYRDVLDTTQAAFRDENSPHVIQSSGILTRQLIDMDIFVPLQDTLEDVDWDEFLDPVTNYYNVDGKLYSMPYNSSNPILYINQDIYEEAGLDPDSPPETFDEMIEHSEEIVESGAADYGWVMPLHSWFFEQWMANMGQDLANNENGRAGRPDSLHLDSEAAQDIFEWWNYNYQEELYVNPGLEDWQESRSIFASQNAGIAIGSTADITSKLDSAEEKDFSIKTGYLPIHDDYERHGTTIGGGSLWVIDGHPQEEIEAAGKLVIYLSSAEQQAEWHKETDYFPVHEDSIEILEDDGWYEDNPNHQTALNQLLDTQSVTSTQGALIGSFPEIRAQVTDAMQYVWEEEKSVEEALKDAKMEAEDILRNYQRIIVD